MNGSIQLIIRPVSLSRVRLTHVGSPSCSFRRNEIQGGAHHNVRCRIVQTYIRSGLLPYQAPSCVAARAKGSKGMGPILIRGVFQPSPRTATHPPWIAVFLLRVSDYSLLFVTLSEPPRCGPPRIPDTAPDPPAACSPAPRRQ